MKYSNIKSFLATLGGKVPASAIHLVNGVLNYLHIGWWFKENGYSVPTISPGRLELYQSIAAAVTEPVSYLEFGVFRGASTRMWSGLLKNESSTLDGFDSFEGLPEVWRMAADLKTFDVEGSIPSIGDSRIAFHKGWFENTLPGFLENYKPTGQLILHIDADLYSSAKYVLSRIEPYVVKGTVIIFDELFDREHELKALDEFLQSFPMELECIGATAGYTQAAFRVIGRTSEGLN